jgi:hypothetical protein
MGRRYAIEVKYSRKIQVVLSHLLPRGILLLQAAKRLKGYIPIVAVVVEKLDQRDIRRMADFIHHFAPEVGWLLVDEYGGGAFKDPEKDEYGILPPLNRQPLMLGSSLESKDSDSGIRLVYCYIPILKPESFVSVPCPKKIGLPS